MPQARELTAAGRVSNDKESLSSATQLANFGVRLSKFTHRFSADGSATLSSNIVLPAACKILDVCVNVSEAYDATIDGTVKAGATDISGLIDLDSEAVVNAPTVANGSGELSLEFSDTITSGECTVAVAWIDLSEMK